MSADKDEWYAGSSRDMTVGARLDSLEQDVRAIKAKVTSLETAGQANTSLLEEIRDVLIVGRLGTAAIKWLGVVAAAALAVWGAIYAATHGGALLK